MVRSESNHTRGKWGGKQRETGASSSFSPVLFCFVFFLFFLVNLACEQALLFGQAKRASRERRGPSRLRRSLVLARLASLAQIGELAGRLSSILRPLSKICDAWNRLRHSKLTVTQARWSLADLRRRPSPIIAPVVDPFFVSSGRALLRDKTTNGYIGDLALVLTDKQTNETNKKTVQLYSCTIEPPSVTTSLDTKIFPESFIIEILVNGPRF